MRKNYCFIFIALFLWIMCCSPPLMAASHTLFFQSQVTVTGLIKDEGDSPLPGVNVLVKGTTIGTMTDGNGRYSINVPSEQAVLVFSFIGYAEQEVTVGSKSDINVAMTPDVKALQEVVVTALGIERSQKSLGYATAKVSNEDFATNRTSNWMNGLSGKIAGVSISALGTGPAGTSKIRIRGQSSISGQNIPLLVVNGVPIDNNNFGTNPGNQGSDTSIGNRGGGMTSDGGDALSSINPDDIENITILKGAAASALYGSRAKDGVIMITTKTKGFQRGLGISYNLNYTNDSPLDFTDYQHQYGQGEYGVRPTTPNTTTGEWSFGEKIEPGMTQTLFNTPNIPYEAQKSVIKKFYRNGQNMTNTVSITAGNDKGGINVSVGSTKATGITPNNSFDRKTVNMGFTYDLSDKVNVRGSVNYSNEYNKNPPVVSEQDNSIPTALFALANTMPLDVLRDNRYNAGGGEYVWSRFTNRVNPYWALSEQFQNIRRDRIFGNVALKYDITNWLSIQGRVGQDYWSRDQDYVNLPTGKASIKNGSTAAEVSGFYNGTYTQDVRRFRETNMDFLVTAAKTFGDFGVNVNVGGNQMRRRTDDNNTQVQDFLVQRLYVVQYARAKAPLYAMERRGVNSLYGSAEINFKQFLYLNATLRNDWFSTLSAANRSIMYPSVSASYVFSDSFTTPQWLNYGKFRLAYAEVGSDTDVPPYSNVLLYDPNANQFNGQPVAGFVTTIPNPNLKPMRTKEIEAGFELKLFNNRLIADLAAYHKLTTDQIVNAQVSDASGYTTKRINSGRSQNQGIELMLNGSPIKTANFEWNMILNTAYNITKVLSLLTDVPGSNITTGNHVFNGSVQQIVGQQMGQIVGFGYRRDDGSVNPDHKGMIVYGANGIPLTTPTQIAFGSALPKWVGGLTNSFSFKGINFSFLIDYKLGNKMLSGTNFNAWRHGLHKATLEGRENTVINGTTYVGGAVVGEGVNANSEINTIPAKVQDYYSVVRGSGLIEPVVYNGGFIKLRQVSIGYDFSRFFKNTPIKGVRLNLVSNNVLMLKKWVDNIDPEGFTYSSDNLVGMESPGLPTTRSVGFNLNVKL
jgi:TonB-linked SusC/RagA family outer membrane protein